GWVLDVVLFRVLIRELVHHIDALAVRVVDLDEGTPLVRQRVLREDRLHRALRFACPAIYALLRVDDEDALRLVDAVHGTDIHAGQVFDVDAGLGDDVGQGRITLLRRSALRRPEQRAPAERSSPGPGRSRPHARAATPPCLHGLRTRGLVSPDTNPRRRSGRRG